MPAIVGLLEEMDRFYGVEDFEPEDVRARTVAAVLFSAVPSASALLAWDEDRLVGIAVYSFLWPAVALTRSLFLKQLHVAEDAQGRGVGRLLMEEVFDVARREGCSRVEWSTDDDNHAAQGFYASMGFAPFPSKVLYRVEFGPRPVT